MALGYLADKAPVRLNEIGGLLLHARGEVVAHLLKLLFLVPSLRGIAAHPDDADHGPGAVKNRGLYGVEIPLSVDGRHYLLAPMRLSGFSDYIVGLLEPFCDGGAVNLRVRPAYDLFPLKAHDLQERLVYGPVSAHGILEKDDVLYRLAEELQVHDVFPELILPLPALGNVPCYAHDADDGTVGVPQGDVIVLANEPGVLDGKLVVGALALKGPPVGIHRLFEVFLVEEGGEGFADDIFRLPVFKLLGDPVDEEDASGGVADIGEVGYVVEEEFICLEVIGEHPGSAIVPPHRLRKGGFFFVVFRFFQSTTGHLENPVDISGLAAKPHRAPL